jgi:hypothetical protein
MKFLYNNKLIALKSQNHFKKKKKILNSTVKKEKKDMKEDIKIKMENIKNLKILSRKTMKIKHNVKAILVDKIKNQDIYKTMIKV